ncbi:MAG: hypothetical protein ACE15F_01770 [bacterium]
MWWAAPRFESTLQYSLNKEKQNRPNNVNLLISKRYKEMYDRPYKEEKHKQGAQPKKHEDQEAEGEFGPFFLLRVRFQKTNRIGQAAKAKPDP